MRDRLERSSYVVDASVVLKRYVREQLPDQADVVEDAPVLTADERLVRALSGTVFEGLAVSLRHVEAQP